MLNGFTHGVAAVAAEAARKSAMKLADGIVAGCGVAFLTVAVWIYIAVQTSHLVAASLLGFVYLIAGGIIILVASRDQRRPSPSPIMTAADTTPFAAGESVVPPLVSAFFFGLNAARQSRQPGPHDPR